MKKVDEFTIFDIIKNEVQSKNRKFVTRNCSICKYPLGYIWINEKLYFDIGCNCFKIVIPNLKLRKESELLEYIRNHLNELQDFFQNESTLLI